MISYPVNNYLLKINSKNTRNRWLICPKLTIKTLERERQHLLPMHPFPTPENITKLLRFSDVFRGQRKDALGTNESIMDGVLVPFGCLRTVYSIQISRLQV